MYRDILLDIPIRSLGGLGYRLLQRPPKPRTGRFRVQSNTLDSVAFPLPLVAVPAHPRMKLTGPHGPRGMTDMKYTELQKLREKQMT